MHGEYPQRALGEEAAASGIKATAHISRLFPRPFLPIFTHAYRLSVPVTVLLPDTDPRGQEAPHAPILAGPLLLVLRLQAQCGRFTPGSVAPWELCAPLAPAHDRHMHPQSGRRQQARKGPEHQAQEGETVGLAGERPGSCFAPGAARHGINSKAHVPSVTSPCTHAHSHGPALHPQAPRRPRRAPAPLTL